jgi:hypothetical protein
MLEICGDVTGAVEKIDSPFLACYSELWNNIIKLAHRKY